ncbi:MAG: hypothetical protein KatS3mg105_1428 [Gemmatales bacterium]|nr:MAG: hypothetical protein KatS3mg105_1428 [Gemmatales bacterium]
MQKQAAPATVKNTDALIKLILKSGLLSQDHIDMALRAVPYINPHKPKELADHLVRLGKLTRFQAFKLLQGAAIGLVLGPFQVLSPLGKGGMGSVYLARDSRDDNLVALKVLPPKRAKAEENLLARFQREMNISKLLDHPHLAKAYEAGVFEGIHYIAMEFIPGKSLYKIVSSEGPMPVGRAAKLFMEVSLGLEHAHEKGLVHRDLKPSNILITPNDHAKILDVGLAIIQGEIAEDRTIVGGKGYVVGTMDYIAPEQAEDALNVDGRADLYSMGCSLYYVLTGQPPFPGGNALQKIMKHYFEEPTPATQINASIPEAFNRIVQKLMMKKRDQRYQTAAEVRRDLEPWVSREPSLPLDSRDSNEWKKAVEEIKSQDLPIEVMTQAIVELPRHKRESPMDSSIVGKGSSQELAPKPAANKWESGKPVAPAPTTPQPKASPAPPSTPVPPRPKPARAPASQAPPKVPPASSPPPASPSPPKRAPAAPPPSPSAKSAPPSPPASAAQKPGAPVAKLLPEDPLPAPPTPSASSSQAQTRPPAPRLAADTQKIRPEDLLPTSPAPVAPVVPNVPVAPVVPPADNSVQEFFELQNNPMFVVLQVIGPFIFFGLILVFLLYLAFG